MNKILNTLAAVITILTGSSQLWSVFDVDHNFEIYQPGIYEGYEWMGLIPITFAVIAVIISSRSRLYAGVIAVLALVLFISTSIIYFNFDSIHKIHVMNWAMYYSAFGLVGGALSGYLLTFRS